MTKDQLEHIIAMFNAQQAATVHLSLLFAEQAGISKGLVADSFRQMAEALQENVNNRETVALVLNQIATGIDSPATEHQKSIEEMIKNVLH
ncbi:hypothetical protein ACRZER_003325 [Raoultella ornithinolytica]|uniref:hypothetical protein n=1 Tax=Klebsiella/Raoultella group TaxID=2890311 RepID=UPI00292B4B2B|nr:hypothetical protein [Raoultella ornithinolytica]HCI7411184.1 hypothetical protein [Klebsiella pneumoniae subsp. pneumoniae Kp001]ELS5456068.1 hypothetical protein [Raoultella ornithinolytica]ELS5480386.1 hypothetical protein [Raoultella ornithinolytica]MDV1388448.1 hypothetical protein [Raoultella ornithinolytica]